MKAYICLCVYLYTIVKNVLSGVCFLKKLIRLFSKDVFKLINGNR